MNGEITPIQKRKIHHFFEVLDNNGNGVLQPDDFKDVAKKICKKIGLDEGSRKYDSIVVQSYRIFIQILTDLEKHSELEINAEEWSRFFEKNIIKPSRMSAAPIEAYITRTVYYIFNLFDENGDGVISREEYANMFDTYSIDKTHIDDAFNRLDSNGDQYLSKQELNFAFHEFFLSTNANSPGNWIFGEWMEE
ncbi:MAG: EF-hand domain-containing protein [Cyclobacteriaceae bacterium]